MMKTNTIPKPRFNALTTDEQRLIRTLTESFVQSVQAGETVPYLANASIESYMPALNSYFQHFIRQVLSVSDDDLIKRQLAEEKYYSVRWHIVLMITVGCTFLDQHSVRAILTQALVDIPELEHLGALFHESMLKKIREEHQ